MTLSLRRFFPTAPAAIAIACACFASIGTAQTSITLSSGSGTVTSDTYNDIIINGTANYILGSGATTTDDVSVRDNGQATINGATINDQVSASGDSQLTFESGSASSGIVSENAVFTLNGGTITNSVFVDTGTLTMNGGSAGTIGGGTSSGGVVNFNGGTLSGGISIEWNLTAIVSGGSTPLVSLNRDGNLVLRAYDFGTGYSGGDVLTLSDLGDDPINFSTAISGLAFSLDYGGGNSDTFNIRANNSGPSTWNGTISLVAVPEPAMGSLLLGAIVMATVVGRRRPRALAKN